MLTYNDLTSLNKLSIWAYLLQPPKNVEYAPTVPEVTDAALADIGIRIESDQNGTRIIFGRARHPGIALGVSALTFIWMGAVVLL